MRCLQTPEAPEAPQTCNLISISQFTDEETVTKRGKMTFQMTLVSRYEIWDQFPGLLTQSWNNACRQDKSNSTFGLHRRPVDLGLDLVFLEHLAHWLLAPTGSRLSSLSDKQSNYQALMFSSELSWTAQNNWPRFLLWLISLLFRFFSHTGKDVQLSLPHFACLSTWLCTAWFSMLVFCCSTGYDLRPSLLVSES